MKAQPTTRPWTLSDLRISANILRAGIGDPRAIDPDDHPDRRRFTPEGVRAVACWLELVGRKGLTPHAQISPRGACTAALLLHSAIGVEISPDGDLPAADIAEVANLLARMGSVA